MPTFKLKDATLDYEVRGDDGPAVVQLHGLTSSRERDTALGVDVAGGLSGCRVLRYDARGHARSTGPRDPASYTWPRLADDLLTLLDHVFPGETVHGVGPSMGVGTLVHAATRDRSRFHGLTLVIPPTAWETRQAQREAYLEAADLVTRSGVEAWVEAGRALPPPPAVDPGLAETWPEIEEGLLPTVLLGAAATDLPHSRVVTGLDLHTLILAWIDDPAHPLSTATRLHDLLPRSELVVARTPADVATWPEAVAAWISRWSARPVAAPAAPRA